MARELRVAAIKAQARRMVEDWEGPQRGSKPAMIAVMKDLLAALAAAQAEREDYADRLGNVKRQRDQARREATHWEQRATRLAALEQVVADNQWLKESHGVTRANDLRPHGYCTGCHDKHPCDTISLLEAIEAVLAAPSGESP